MKLKIFRRGSPKYLGLLSAFITILLCLYYISIGQPSTPVHKDLRKKPFKDGNKSHDSKDGRQHNTLIKPVQQNLHGSCYELYLQETNITTSNVYAEFDFQPEWIRTKEYWDKTFEDRYDKQLKDNQRHNLKIIIVPHSHNDPGWLKTYINYFQSDSRQILNLIVTKMTEYKDMTFIWSEISFLQLWWDQAHPTKRRALRKLIDSGRFEITTGGWVMTDEANVHIYAMIDQLIEGHQWIKTNLNTKPTVGWSIDPFGHGSTVPYLLAASGFNGTIIQRIHYAWKQWLAKQQNGDFMWQPVWKTSDNIKRNLLTHNMPFDIYSIKHSCGPHPFICLNFDFRKISGEYTEASVKAQFITDDNIVEKAQLLIDQYSRTASLFTHNVALIPLGDDFRYNKETEIDQQYINYKKLIDYINSRKDYFNAEISFGTPKDYFREIKRRTKEFPSLKGDFFVYSDIFSEGRPAYWSGYFSTRPFYKILSNELEHNLRSSEILFTLAYNIARLHKHSNSIKVLEKNYEKIILARRNLGLFQHHDAITGTSKSFVMRDYGLRLFESIQDSVKMQESTIEMLLQNNTFDSNFLLSELERDNFNKLPRKTPISFGENNEKLFVVFNSLAQKRLEIISIRTITPHVQIMDVNGVQLEHQVNPIWSISDEFENINNISMLNNEYEVLFLAELPPISLSTFRIVTTANNKINFAIVYCNDCFANNTVFEMKSKQAGDIQLENNKMRLLFDEKTGFLKSVTRKNFGKSMHCAIKFAAYKSAQFHSGAYLFKTDREQKDAEINVLEQYQNKIIITSGPLTSDITVIYGPFLAHTVRIFNTRTHLDAAIYIENDVDFEPPPKNRETELFMRFMTEIENGEIPEFYSDQNGFQFHHRIKVPSIGIEGNYFPITTAAFIQDTTKRITLLTTHSQGAASLEPGELEVMLDRRTLYDDHRGMGEGIVDSKLTRHKFWLIIEDKNVKLTNSYQVPSLLANNLGNSLRYPPNIYFIDDVYVKVPKNLKKNLIFIPHNQFPCDIHLMNIRTLTEEQLPLFPSRSALMLLHRQGYDCTVGQQLTFWNNTCTANASTVNVTFNSVQIESIESTSLTGLNKMGSVNNSHKILIEPMDIQTFNLTFKFEV